MKRLLFIGSSLRDLRTFPARARKRAGQQMEQVQRGLDPDDWKPMLGVGPGVREVRVRDDAGAFRVIYLATRPEAVYVLHVFQKTSQATSRRDLDLAAARFRQVMRSGGG